MDISISISSPHSPFLHLYIALPVHQHISPTSIHSHLSLHHSHLYLYIYSPYRECEKSGINCTKTCLYSTHVELDFFGKNNSTQVFVVQFEEVGRIFEIYLWNVFKSFWSFDKVKYITSRNVCEFIWVLLK